MNETARQLLEIREQPALNHPTLVLAFEGWMDGGDVSTGTVRRLIELLDARPIAAIDPDPFYIFNFPGSMEIASLFRPHIKIKDGLVEAIDMPSDEFYCHETHDLILFLGKEPNLKWRTFGECVFEFARSMNVQRILFVGSFGGAVPHTREPRLFISCSESRLLAEMEQYGVRRTGYEGPGSFTSYLMTQATSAGLDMVSLVAEIPGYLQGTNILSIEAVTRRLAKILQVPLDLDSLRSASTQWELEVSRIVAEDEELASQVHQLEEEYDNALLELNADDE